jgi:hypothetical protein
MLRSGKYVTIEEIGCHPGRHIDQCTDRQRPSLASAIAKSHGMNGTDHLGQGSVVRAIGNDIPSEPDMGRGLPLMPPLKVSCATRRPSPRRHLLALAISTAGFRCCGFQAEARHRNQPGVPYAAVRIASSIPTS